MQRQGACRIMDLSGDIAVFLQARIGSSRLPGKALLSLGGRTVIGNAMKQLKKIKCRCHALLTDHESFGRFKPEAEKYGFLIFEGPAEDVLARYVLACRKYRVHTVVRATGDNPLVFGICAADIVEYHLKTDSDRSCFAGLPLGGGVEAVKVSALEEALRESSSSYDHEHVTSFLYNRPGRYKISMPECRKELWYPEGRITLDTADDFGYLKKIFSLLPEEDPCADLPFLVRQLRANPFIPGGK